MRSGSPPPPAVSSPSACAKPMHHRPDCRPPGNRLDRRPGLIRRPGVTPAQRPTGGSGRRCLHGYGAAPGARPARTAWRSPGGRRQGRHSDVTSVGVRGRACHAPGVMPAAGTLSLARPARRSGCFETADDQAVGDAVSSPSALAQPGVIESPARAVVALATECCAGIRLPITEEPRHQEGGRDATALGFDAGEGAQELDKPSMATMGASCRRGIRGASLPRSMVTSAGLGLAQEPLQADEP
jgi:hypothetical protein